MQTETCYRHTRTLAVAGALLLSAAGCLTARAGGVALPPLPVLSPTALTADAADGRAYLRWNPQIEDARVVGWQVVRSNASRRARTEVLKEPATVITNLENGTEYRFAVVGVLADGTRTPPGNPVTVTPRKTGQASVAGLGGKLAVGKREIALAGPSVRITFPDGQALVYDRFRPVDWQARDGEHLIAPEHFGNGLDIGQFDKRGLPDVIPPGGATTPTLEIEGRRYRFDPPVTREYAQQGSRHPHLTDPVTPPLDRPHHQTTQPRWVGATTDGDRVTLHYTQPIAMMGCPSWQRVQVWETWWPIERELHGTTYHGLARMVEVQMPGAWNTGYQVMLNNGFGPGGGSREGVISYSTGFRVPGHEIVDFSGPTNRQVVFQKPRPPRQGALYHPNHNSLQASPLIFYNWDRTGARGSLLIAARSLYYHCANASASYAEQGADGVWPNLAWDLAQPGVRTRVDTVEYLYAPAPAQPLPQRFVNARFWAYGNVSRRMGVQDRLAVVSTHRPHGEVKQRGGPQAYADYYARQCRDWGVDALDTPFDFWIGLPFVVDDRWRNDPSYRDNADIAAMCRTFKAAGFKVGYWLRPELLTTSIGSALSATLPTPDDYAWCGMVHYPDAARKLAAEGIPEFRENPDWARRQLDGSWPARTPYDWVPMSLASGWHDRMIWPALKTAAAMGFSCVLVDGGFGGMQGVDYSPMVAGRSKLPLPMQPFWWRFWRTMEHAGIRPYGECTRGWKGGDVFFGGEGDQHYAWMFQMGWYREKPMTPKFLHQLHQLYNSTEFRPGDELLPVRRYAVEFNRRNPGPPDWIELVDLRQGEAIAITVQHREGPATGLPDTGEKESAAAVKVRPWTWGDAIWHYDDGTSVVYPGYDRVKWGETGK